MKPEEYFVELKKSVEKDLEIAQKARAVGIDPVSEVEVPLATSLAEKVVGLVSTVYPQVLGTGIVGRILELEKQYSSLDPAVALTIAEEVAKEKFCKFDSHLQAVEAGARVAIAYLTLGVVSSPIEGFTNIEIGKTKDGKDYFRPFYAGPIRSAGGTEAAFSLVIVDYLREIFGYAPYDPTEDEIKRGIHETYLYHERINNLQYLPSEKEIDGLMRHLPVQISGDASEDKEVFNYKDLPRVGTNFIRSGFCLTLNEGMAGKAPKILKRIKKLREKGFALTNWSWLEEFVKMQTEIKESKKVGSSSGGATYIKDLVAGRPVFGHPSYSGSFRLRYGRSRTTGYSTLAIHPSAMHASGDFIAIGTQLKIEKPTKGCTVASCTDIEPPIVKLKNGSVKQLYDVAEASKIYPEIVEIIYSGDILIPYGDYANRNHALDKPGYVEQYWLVELKKTGGNSVLFPSFQEALQLSQQYGVSLHPKYIFYWREISSEQLFGLIDWLSHSNVQEEFILLPYSAQERERFAIGKRALELIGCVHEVTTANVIIKKHEGEPLLFNLGKEYSPGSLEHAFDDASLKLKEKPFEKVLEGVNLLAKFKIRDKSGTFIGSRMGRPEKAKLRKLTGSPHVLFPVGEQGGRLRSFQEAMEQGFVQSEFPNFFCNKCGTETIYPKCDVCGEQCRLLFYDFDKESLFKERPAEGRISTYRTRKIDVKSYFDKAKKLLNMRLEELPVVVKGIRGTSSKDHSTEHLAKGLLRAKYNLNVNKDGTIRYDMTEMPITQFTPEEVGASVEKLKALGYSEDIEGKPLESRDQLLELFPHDIILPADSGCEDEPADSVFIRVANFIDDELEKLYGLPKYFNIKKREDLIGHLFACIAPHNCASVVGRLVGFANSQALLASPYMHAAMRRDCDGDEAAAMLMMDMLLNFSRRYLPSHRGGTQDAPLVLNACIRAGEVDDMIFDLDVGSEIPLELYEAAELEKNPSEVKMPQIKGRLGKGNEFTQLCCTYGTKNINLGPGCSVYKTLPTMGEKVDAQMELCKKLRAVDVSDVARLIIERHLIRDTRGNLRKFSMQAFRCVNCNESYRRPPLIGKCTKCGGKLLFTISEGSVLKYMQRALDLARTYKVKPYLIESLELTETYIHSIFGKEKEKQEALKKWFS